MWALNGKYFQIKSLFDNYLVFKNFVWFFHEFNSTVSFEHNNEFSSVTNLENISIGIKKKTVKVTTKLTINNKN